jgi:hypothetical protein
MGLCVMGMAAACVFYAGLWMGNRRKDAQRDDVVDNGEMGRVEVLSEKGAGFGYSL